MSFVVYLGEMLEVKVGVDLGGRNVGMAQQLLHSAQVVAGFQQVGSEGMPEEVRVNL
jgi:hypothetical protein